MIDSLVATFQIYRYRCERRWRLEAKRVASTVSVAVVAPLVVLVALCWPWDVIADWASSIANAVKNAIVWVANTIAGIIVTVVNDVWSFAGDLASGIADALSFVVDIGNSAFGLLKTVWEQWIPDAIHMAAGVAQAIVDTAAHYLRIAIDAVRTTVGAIATELSGVYGWAYTNIFRPLLGAIGDVGGWVWNTFAPWVLQQINSVGAILQRAVDAVWDGVRTAVDIVARYGSIIVRWFTEGLHFIVFVLEHPFTWWTQIVHDAFARGSDTLDSQVVALLDRRGGDILDNLSKWVG